MRITIRRVIPIFLLLPLTALSGPAQDDITFIVAGKTSNHRQQADGSVQALIYHFFAEIFLKPNGEVEPASLANPLGGGERTTFAR